VEGREKTQTFTQRVEFTSMKKRVRKGATLQGQVHAQEKKRNGSWLPGSQIRSLYGSIRRTNPAMPKKRTRGSELRNYQRIRNPGKDKRSSMACTAALGKSLCHLSE
jgi:hypothetical protein